MRKESHHIAAYFELKTAEMGYDMLAQFAVYNHKQRDTSVRSANNLAYVLLDVFRAAVIGSSVIGFMFRWNHVASAEAVRAVSIDRRLRTVVFGGDSRVEIPDRVREIVGGKYIAGQVVQRDPEDMRNHNKLFLFEAVDWFQLRGRGLVVPDSPLPDSAGPAIWISSSNLTAGNEMKCNQAVLVPLSYSAMGRIAPYLLELAAGYSNEGHKRNHYRVVRDDVLPSTAPRVPAASVFPGQAPVLAGAPAKAGLPHDLGSSATAGLPVGQGSSVAVASALYQFFPNRNGNDPVVEMLQRIEHYERPSSKSCEIRVTTPRWHDDRIAVAYCLQRLVANGAKVEIICRGPDETFEEDDNSLELGPAVWKVLKQCTTRYYQAEDVNIHSKYILIDAPYRESPAEDYAQATLVLSGTANLTGPAISSNWETLVLLRDYPGAYDAFLIDFQSLSRERSADSPVSPPN